MASSSMWRVGVGLVVLTANTMGVVLLQRGTIGFAAVLWVPFTAVAGFVTVFVLREHLVAR